MLEDLGVNSTYLHLANGIQISLKIGRVKGMAELDSVKNILHSTKDLLKLFQELGLKKENI